MKRQRATSLVGLLATVAIIGILAVAFFFGGNSLFSNTKGEDGEPTTVPGKAIRAGEVTAENENIRQIRMLLDMSYDEAGQFPATLDELNLPESTITSPVNGKRFAYDPATGDVRRSED